MVVEQWVGKIFRGLSGDTKPTDQPRVAHGSIYIETNTGVVYVFNGSTLAWQFITPDPTGIASWIIYKASSTLYKAKNAITGATPYSGTNLITDVWNNVRSNPTFANFILFKNADTPYDVQSGSTLDIVSTAREYSVSGESEFGTLIRPLGNTTAFQVTNMRKFSLRDIGFYTDQGTSYTNDMVRILASSGGCERIKLRDVNMRMDAGTSDITQAGRGLVLLLTGSGPDVSWLDASNLMIQGFINAYRVAHTAISARPPIAWINEMSFFRCNSQHSKTFFQAVLPDPTDQLWSWHFKDCAWQTTGTGALASTQDCMFDWDVFGTNLAITRGIHIDNCVMWDPLNNTIKFFKSPANIYCDLDGGGVYPSSGSDSLGDQWMGGTGWNATTGEFVSGAKVSRRSPTAERNGVSIQSGNGSTTVFNIAHGLLATPKLWDVRPRSTAAGNPTSFTPTVTATNIVLTYAVAPANGTNNLTWQWWAREYI